MTFDDIFQLTWLHFVIYFSWQNHVIYHDISRLHQIQGWNSMRYLLSLPMKAILTYVMSIKQCQPRKDPSVQPCITALDNWWSLEEIYNTSSCKYWQSSCLFLFNNVYIGMTVGAWHGPSLSVRHEAGECLAKRRHCPLSSLVQHDQIFLARHSPLITTHIISIHCFIVGEIGQRSSCSSSTSCSLVCWPATWKFRFNTSMSKMEYHFRILLNFLN